MSLPAEIWVLIAFVCFLCICFNKLRSLIYSQTDSYIEEIKCKISEAERMKDEASKFLKQACEKRNQVHQEIEKCKNDAKINLENMKLEQKRHIELMNNRYRQALDERMNTEIQRQKSVISSKIVDCLINEILKNVDSSKQVVDLTKFRGDLEKLLQK